MDAEFESMSLREQVQAEAMANGYRRETARQVGSTIRGLRGPTAPLFDVGDRLRSIAAELEAEEAIARRSERMKAPSDLIATVNRRWPKDAAAVKAYAAAKGLSLGEAWARLIGKAARAARNGGGE
jgi:hypothetical protein